MTMVGRHVSNIPPAPEPRPVRAFILTVILQLLGILIIAGVGLAVLFYLVFIH
jgi:hypothetical protein